MDHKIHVLAGICFPPSAKRIDNDKLSLHKIVLVFDEFCFSAWLNNGRFQQPRYSFQTKVNSCYLFTIFTKPTG